MSSAICFHLDQSKFLSSGHGLTQTSENKNYSRTVVNPVRNVKFQAHPNSKSLQRTISVLMKNAEF